MAVVTRMVLTSSLCMGTSFKQDPLQKKGHAAPVVMLTLSKVLSGLQFQTLRHNVACSYATQIASTQLSCPCVTRSTLH